MIRNQFILPLHHKLVIDYFAGGGGASTGIELALGRHVDHAVNHDAKALGMHRINHPQTVHHCEDVFDVDPWKLTEGRPVGLIHFSPDCKHFSKAKGGKPLDKRIRGLVLVMLKWAKYGAEVMSMENVEEIVTWGPVNRNGRPIKRHKGRTWRAFLDCLGGGIRPNHPDLREILAVVGDCVTKEDCVRGFRFSHGYTEIRARDHDTATIRKRLFMIARSDGREIVWPAASNGPVKRPTLIDGTQGASRKRILPYRMIAECIDWDLPCHSIFLTQAQAKKRGLNVKRPLVKATQRRIATGIDRFVLKAAEPFIVSLTHQGWDRLESVMEPARTITGAHRGEKALVSPILTEHANASKQRTFRADEPLRTQCGEVKGGHFALVASTMVQTGYGERTGQRPRALDLKKPVGTIVGTGKHALVSGTLVGAGGRAAQSRPRGLNEPLHTATAKGDTCLATAVLVHTAHGEQDKNGKKRGRGAHDVREGLPSTTASPDCAVAMVKLRGTNIGDAVTAPMHTASAGGQHHGVVAGFLAQHNGGFNETPGHAATEPLSTVTGRGTQQQIVATSLVGFHKACKHGQAVDRPSNAATTKPRLGLVESTLSHGLSPEDLAGARRVARFLRANGVKFEGELAMVRGCVMVDIGMRMLTPRELFRAQGFPEEYVIDRAWLVCPTTGSIREVKLTKEEQIRMCGNSVCPKVMRDLVKANVPYLAAWFPEERKRSRRRELAAA